MKSSTGKFTPKDQLGISSAGSKARKSELNTARIREAANSLDRRPSKAANEVASSNEYAANSILPPSLSEGKTPLHVPKKLQLG